MPSLLARLREAVSATSEPQLQRGQSGDDENTEDRDGDGRDRRKARKRPKPADQKPARESVALRVLIREATVTKAGKAAYEVTIVREGPGNPEDDNYYTGQALREAVQRGLFEGLQAYLNHPTPTEERERPERDVRYLAGHFREARYVDGHPAEVRAKFIPGGMERDGVVALIESALESMPDRPLIGISIDGYGHAPDQQQVNGRTYNMVREVTHLGSADIVTRAGAGGRFHRRLQEAWRTTGPAERRPDTSKEATMKPAKLQEKIKAAVAQFEEASGLDETQSERADELVKGALGSLRECATAELDLPKAKVEIREVEKPVAATEAEKDKIAAELETTKTQLREAQTERDSEKRRRKDAEGKADLMERGRIATKVIREAQVPEKTAIEWFDDVVACEDEQAMRKLVERKKEARDELLAELRESFVGVEGAGPRAPSAPAGGGGTDLLDTLGLDRDEYVPAA